MGIWKQETTLDTLNHLFNSNMMTHLGIEFTEIGEDYLVGRMPVDERTRQPFGLLHGGASVVLAETLGSCAANMCLDPEKQYAVGLDVNANHLRAVKEGYVYGTARPLHRGRSTHVWEIRIETAEQKPVAISRLTMAVKDR